MRKTARSIVILFSTAVLVLFFQNCAQNNYGLDQLDSEASLNQFVENPTAAGGPPSSESELPPASDQAGDIEIADENNPVSIMPVVVPDQPTEVIHRVPSTVPVPPSTSNQPAPVLVLPSEPPTEPAPPKTVVCDPFTETKTTTKPGILGEIYSLPTNTTPSSVAGYIREEYKMNVDLLMSQINVPTRHFEKGFAANDGDLLRNSQGGTLMEYFGLRLKSSIRLSEQDEPGSYQLAVLSDDGAVLNVAINGQSLKIVDNDGTHPSKLACANRPLVLDRNSRIPMSLSYYQGPRVSIALMLLWRKVPANQAVPAESQCGRSGDRYFFDTTTVPSTPTSNYVGLMARGWKVLKPENFEMTQTSQSTSLVCK